MNLKINLKFNLKLSFPTENVLKINFLSQLGFGKIVEVLVQNGADVTMKDEEGKTILEIANENGMKIELLRIITRFDFNVSQKRYTQC